MQFLKETDVKSSQTPPESMGKRDEEQVSTHYLVDNQTGKGVSGKQMLDNFTGTKEQLFKAVRGLLQLPEFDITLEYLDTVMEEYLPLPEDMEFSELPRVAVMRVFKTNEPPASTK